MYLYYTIPTRIMLLIIDYYYSMLYKLDRQNCYACDVFILDLMKLFYHQKYL